MIKRKLIAISFASIMAFGLNGCISLLPKPGKPPAISVLRAANIVEGFEKTQNSIIIDTPNMERAFSSNDIAVLLDNGAYAFIDGVSLSTPAPKALQNLLLETFDKSGAYKLAAKSSSSVRADYFLAFDITHFEVTEPKWRKNGEANIEISARLIDFSNRKPISSKTFTATAPAKRGTPLEPVRALEAASQLVALDILKWSLAEIKIFQESKAASANK